MIPMKGLDISIQEMIWIILNSSTNYIQNYHRLYLDYTYGLGKIYSQEEINRAKAYISFDREDDLKFTGGAGDVFHRIEVDAITSDSYDPTQPNLQAPHWMGVDPGFGSSSTAIEVVHAEEITKGIYEHINTY
jgi:hypothetical protein